MKAIIFDHYGPPNELKFGEVTKPSPKKGEVLVKVKSAALNAADWHIMLAEPAVARLMLGLFRPKCHLLGLDLAGVVESLGEGVSGFKAGDEVYGCMKFPHIGSFAEYACVDASLLEFKPTNMTFDEAAAVPLAAGTALEALQMNGPLKAGLKVLVNGASGGVGTYAIQIAKAFGATVTAVCSAGNVEQSRALGADFVIDYQKENFTQNGERYDIILAANGYHPLSAYKNALNPGGLYAMSGGAGKQMAEAIFMGPLLSMGSGKKLKGVDFRPRREYLTLFKGLAESGKLKSVIDRRYRLERLPEAIAYLYEGHAKGKLVITVEP